MWGSSPHTNWTINSTVSTNWVSSNSVLFWHYLAADSSHFRLPTANRLSSIFLSDGLQVEVPSTSLLRISEFDKSFPQNSGKYLTYTYWFIVKNIFLKDTKMEEMHRKRYVGGVWSFLLSLCITPSKNLYVQTAIWSSPEISLYKHND